MSQAELVSMLEDAALLCATRITLQSMPRTVVDRDHIRSAMAEALLEAAQACNEFTDAKHCRALLFDVGKKLSVPVRAP